jgi:hypothetical protein
MPRYLRWTAAVTSGLVTLFALGAAVGALAVGTGNKQIRGGFGFLVVFLAQIVPVVVSLAVNDWLRERYGPPTKASRRERSETADRAG